MKKYFNYLILVGIVGFVFACGEKWDFRGNQTLANTGAKVRFIHAAPDAPGVDVFVNDQKFSGALVSSTNPTGSILYGGVFPTSDYAQVAAGAAKVSVRVPSLSNAEAASATASVEKDKMYSVFATGLSPTYESVLINDVLPDTSSSVFYVRVVNMVSNSTGVNLTMTAFNGTALTAPPTLATGITYKNASQFIGIGVPVGYKGGTVNVSFGVRTEGPVVSNLTFAVTNTFQPGRVITLFVRGLGATSTTVASRFPVATGAYINR